MEKLPSRCWKVSQFPFCFVSCHAVSHKPLIDRLTLIIVTYSRLLTLHSYDLDCHTISKRSFTLLQCVLLSLPVLRCILLSFPLTSYNLCLFPSFFPLLSSAHRISWRASRLNVRPWGSVILHCTAENIHS